MAYTTAPETHTPPAQDDWQHVGLKPFAKFLKSYGPDLTQQIRDLPGGSEGGTLHCTEYSDLIDIPAPDDAPEGTAATSEPRICARHIEHRGADGKPPREDEYLILREIA